MTVQVHDLHKRYGETVAVDGVSFGAGAREIFGLLGPNGAGETTTVECVLGPREPDRGTVTVPGMEHPVDSARIKARVGAQLQTTGL